MKLVDWEWWTVNKRATIVDLSTLVHRFAMSGDYILEKVGRKFYSYAGKAVEAQELVILVQGALVEQAKGMPSFMTNALQQRAREVAEKLVDDPVVVAEATEIFSRIAEAQRAVGISETVEQTTVDLAVWVP